MLTKEEVEIAIRVINEITGEPDSGVIADLVRDLKNSSAPVKETRVAEPKETR
jgi:hypothetical protein